jgi:alpha-tubulin suppressor-like RCC1 family protein
MTKRAATALLAVATLSAGCESRLDVIAPKYDGGASHAHDSGNVHDAGKTVRDAALAPHDARAPLPHDGALPPPDVFVPPNHAVTDLRASTSDTCAVAGGTLYCWGLLADGSTSKIPTAVRGSAAGAFRAVSGGAAAHCATQPSGSVFCWGSNDRGELAQGDRNARTTPARVALPSAAHDVAGRFDSFCAQLEDGRLECWGQNDEGQMGQSDAQGSKDALLPVQVETATDWVSVSTGQGHVCGIRGSGALYCWGRNTDGELGQGSGASVQIRTPTLVPGIQDWLAVAAGQNHTCGLRAPGRLYCFGSGVDGQLAVSPRTSSDVPLQVGDATDFRAVSTDTFHGCGIRGQGELYCWGRNAEGQLGTGDTRDRDTPTRIGDSSDWADVSVGRFHTCARRTDGSAWCTGANDSGQLGTADTERRNVLSPVIWAEG